MVFIIPVLIVIHDQMLGDSEALAYILNFLFAGNPSHHRLPGAARDLQRVPAHGARQGGYAQPRPGPSQGWILRRI